MTGGGGGRLLHRAVATAVDHGWWVFPLRPRSKVPAFPQWQELATRDPDRIRAWFEAAPYNIGISAGPSDLLVIDLDGGHGQPAPAPWTGARGGADVLAGLAAAAGQPYPDDTFTVSTPSGQHLYFRHPPRGPALGSSVGRLGWRIDTRGRGGYVVGAGSVRAQGYYRVMRRAPIAPLPQWLADQLVTIEPRPAPCCSTLAATAESPSESTSESPSAAAVSLAGTVSDARRDAYVRAVVRDECAQVRGAPPGTRHVRLLRAARVLGEFVGAAALPLTAAREQLRAAAAHHDGVEQWSTATAHRAIDDGLAYGQRRPRRW